MYDSFGCWRHDQLYDADLDAKQAYSKSGKVLDLGDNVSSNKHGA